MFDMYCPDCHTNVAVGPPCRICQDGQRCCRCYHEEDTMKQAPATITMTAPDGNENFLDIAEDVMDAFQFLREEDHIPIRYDLTPTALVAHLDSDKSNPALHTFHAMGKSLHGKGVSLTLTIHDC